MAEKPGTERPCSRCGMPLVFLEGKSGPDKCVPAQAVPAVYVRIDNRVRRVRVWRVELEDGSVVEATEGLPLFVNHWATCPHAKEFARRGRSRASGK